MKTYREIVYLVLDSLKLFGDDSVWEDSHIVAQVNKYRSLLIKQRYLDRKKEIPTAFFQRLNVKFDTAYFRGDIYKSLKPIPNSVDNGLIHAYTHVSSDGISSMNFNFITPQRFKVVGYNKWLRNEIYVTIDLDNYMYVKSPVGDIANTIAVAVDSGNNTYYTQDESEQYQLVFDNLKDSYIVYDTILDNPIDADGFNDVNTLDILDLNFPCDESLVQTVIELTINEIAKLNGIHRDVLNNANDDVSMAANNQKQ